MSGKRGLVADRIRVGYGDVIAVWDVSLTVAASEVVALVGRNGGGKSTTVRAIAGLLPLTKGRVTLDGEDLIGIPVHARAGRGLSVVPEGRRIFRSFTVERNLALGLIGLRARSALARQRYERVFDRLPILADRRTAVAGSLSGGQQQLLAIAQALMSGPSCLVLDEPTAGLSPSAVHDVYELTMGLVADGIGVLLVEERADLVADVATRIVRLDQGRVSAVTRPCSELGEPSRGAGQQHSPITHGGKLQ